jgi:DNA-binding NarL/FixJ family response regulator
MLTVVIADDQAIMRIGLKEVLSAFNDISMVEEVTSASCVLSKLRAYPVGILILGMSTPDIKGIDLIRRVYSEFSSLPILIFGKHSDTQIISRVLRAAPTTSYVKRNCEPRVLLGAVQAVVEGRRFIDPTLSDAMIFSRYSNDKSPHMELSNRELQVLQLLAAGKRIGEIADELTLSAKTVSTHKIRMMKKLEIENSMALVRYALEHGFPSTS